MGWAYFECDPDKKKAEVEAALNASGFSGLAVPTARGWDLRLHCRSYPDSPLGLAIAETEPHARSLGVMDDPKAGMGWVACYEGDAFFADGWRVHHLGDIFIGKLVYRFRCLEDKDDQRKKWLTIPETKGYLTFNCIESNEYWVSADENGHLKIEKIEEKPQ